MPHTLRDFKSKRAFLLSQRWDWTGRLALMEKFVAISRPRWSTCSTSKSMARSRPEPPCVWPLPEAMSTESGSYCAEYEAVVEGRTWLGSLGRSREASESGGKELALLGDRHSEWVVVRGGTWVLALWSRPSPSLLLLLL